jgi:hypothetical protein
MVVIRHLQLLEARSADRPSHVARTSSHDRDRLLKAQGCTARPGLGLALYIADIFVISPRLPPLLAPETTQSLRQLC